MKYFDIDYPASRITPSKQFEDRDQQTTRNNNSDYNELLNTSKDYQPQQYDRDLDSVCFSETYLSGGI